MRHREDRLKRGFVQHDHCVTQKEFGKCFSCFRCVTKCKINSEICYVRHRLSTMAHRKSKAQPRDCTNASNSSINKNRRAKSKTTMQLTLCELSAMISFQVFPCATTKVVPYIGKIKCCCNYFSKNQRKPQGTTEKQTHQRDRTRTSENHVKADQEF